MKLVTYLDARGAERAGALYDDERRIADLAAAHEARKGRPNPDLASLQALIEGGAGALEEARAALAFVEERAPDGTSVFRADVKLRAPLPRPVQIRDFLCFEEHLKGCQRAVVELTARMSADPEATREELIAAGKLDVPPIWYAFPAYYKGNRMSVIGPDEDILWPDYCNMLDYELELGAVIGTAGKDIPAEKARDHIFGYTVFNDMSARDAQTREMQAMLGPCKGKDFDTGNVFGPCIVTADEVDPDDLTMIARVNGEEWSRGNSSAMYHGFGDCIAHASRSETIHPGEIFGSGTVGGGCGLEHLRFLSPGDVVELEVEGIGILRNRIVKPDR